MPYTSIGDAELAVMVAASPLPPQLQRAQIFNFDTTVFPFRESVAGTRTYRALITSTLTTPVVFSVEAL